MTLESRQGGRLGKDIFVSHHDPQNVVRLEKGKPSERAGRKATGLSPYGDPGDMAAGLPGEYSTSRAGSRGQREIQPEVLL